MEIRNRDPTQSKARSSIAENCRRPIAQQTFAIRSVRHDSRMRRMNHSRRTEQDKVWHVLQSIRATASPQGRYTCQTMRREIRASRYTLTFQIVYRTAMAWRDMLRTPCLLTGRHLAYRFCKVYARLSSILHRHLKWEKRFFLRNVYWINAEQCAHNVHSQFCWVRSESVRWSVGAKVREDLPQCGFFSAD